MVRRFLPKSIKQLVHWYERYISPLGLIVGFISDNLILLRRVDLWTTDALFLFYLGLSSVGIVLINLIEFGKIRHRLWTEGAPLVPVVVQFCFGGLFSGFLSLYSRSAGYLGSWIFVAIVAALLIGNERFSRFYVRPVVQVSILFTTLFGFLIFFLPVVFKQIGPWMFIASGICAIVLLMIFMFLLISITPAVQNRLRSIAIAVGAIYILFNTFYFTNTIPPLPLSLKDAGVYHSVAHDSAAGVYVVSGEPEPWYDIIAPFAPSVFHEAPGESAFVYTSVFAPSGLSTKIVHEWQHYDPTAKKWDTLGTIEYPIQGGRDGGYEGYSEFPNPAPGAWRVNVLTGFGQLIGRVSFTVVSASTTPALGTETK